MSLSQTQSLQCYHLHRQRAGEVPLPHPYDPHSRGREFQAQFHPHVEDKGIRHVYIRPRSPELAGKFKRWESFYNTIDQMVLLVDEHRMKLSVVCCSRHQRG